MDIQLLYKEFQKKSSSTDDDLKNLDSKHISIIKNSKKNLKTLNQINFRNWSDQNDMGLRYPMTYLAKVFVGSKKNTFLEFFTSIIKKRINNPIWFAVISLK